jgi:hypothetical protein
MATDGTESDIGTINRNRPFGCIINSVAPNDGGAGGTSSTPVSQLAQVNAPVAWWHQCFRGAIGTVAQLSAVSPVLRGGAVLESVCAVRKVA